MNKKTNKEIPMLAKMAAIILVLGMFTAVPAYAAAPQVQNQNTLEQSQTFEDRVSDAQKTYQDSRERFLDAKEQFGSARTGANILDLKNATRDFLNHTIDYTIIRIDALIARAEITEDNGLAPFEFSENLEDYKVQLEELKDDVATADTREDFQAVISDIRDIWQHVHLESRYFIIGTLDNRVDMFLERGDSIIVRVQEEINRLEAAGEDTQELEKLLADYEKALDDARKTHEDAEYLFNEHNGFDDNGVLVDAQQAREFLSDVSATMRETHQDLKESNSILREIFTQLKEHRPGSVNLQGTGKMTASGDGKATLSGNLGVDVQARNGVLTITDYGGDAEIQVTGKGTKEVMDDGTIRYTGFDGAAAISGSSVTVVIEGEDIELTAEGTGSAVLRGYGTYSANGREVKNNWAEQTNLNTQNQNESSQLRIQNETVSQHGTATQAADTATADHTQVKDQGLNPGGK